MYLRFSLRIAFLSALTLILFQSSIADDIDRNFTSVGKIGLTITNYGTIGDRNDYYNQGQPSCQYPLGNRDPIEHIYQGGLWVGAIPRNNPEQLVSTGAHDRLYTTVTSGEPVLRPEFSSPSGNTMLRRSNDVESAYFSEQAKSNQDYVAWYVDTNLVNPTSGLPIPHHTPLGIAVKQESYAWKFPYVDFFVILNYTIHNVSSDILDSVYVGLWYNGVVRNTAKNRPGTSGYFVHGANGYMDTLRMMYTFDYDGLPSNAADANADSYVGVKLLGSTPFPRGVDSAGNLQQQTFFNGWKFQASGGTDPAYFSPQDDQQTVQQARSRYDRLASSLPNGPPPNDYISQLRTRADNMSTMLSVGPFASLNPGDSVNVVFGVFCARKFGTGLARNDTRDQRKTLIADAIACQRAYEGEDINGNNVLDQGEDINGNGILDHYLLPQPPHEPKIHLEVGNQSAAIYWDKSSSELSLDPISHRYDFEGYRVYRSNAGADFSSSDLLLTLALAGQFDLRNGTGYDTGLDTILLPQPKYFPPDTVAYWYRFPPSGVNLTHLNGWQYLYGVSAFDQGDSAFGVTSLESKVQIGRVVPGTLPTSDASKQVGVYPNPYYVNAVWDGAGERTRKLYFYNLPKRCEIRVFTLSGDVVATINHDAATYNGSDINWFQPYNSSGTSVQFAGGEHAWDLITKFDQAIATGLYLFSVKDSDTGETKTGKFLVIK